ncbi:ERF family protein [Clostridium sardiniense]|uniref:ERF family protein n=1 Tax=Clostridium sardiniense TaxID=29369 RepID=UPI0019584096|nr:ERF family protein [Clostridium sardiniense]MBM7835919.1 hypothetical protein [Clostridium sardiniense]
MNLWQKLIEVRKKIDNFVKDTKGYGYQYVSGSQVLGKIKPKLDELGVILKVETDDMVWTTYDYTSSKGEGKTDFVVSGKVKYTWINADNPEEREECSFDIFGQQDDISKAFGSGLTYSERYFILKSLQAPTDNDDPDSRDTRGKVGKNNSETYRCNSCAKEIQYNVAKFSYQKFGKSLCMDCQKKEGK